MGERQPSTSQLLFDLPYYAVIFTSQRGTQDEPGYSSMADQMAALAAQQPGYLGVESARGADGLGITVSYWQTLDDIAAWRRHAEHQVAREQGRADWYAGYSVRISKVERAYGWTRSDVKDGSAAPTDSGPRETS
jgi:heme-degrading monooxygenase HmoA